MEQMPQLPQRIVRDVLQRLRELAPQNNLGVPSVEGVKDSPSTWRFINRYRAEVFDAAGEILEAKTAYLAKLKALRMAYEDYQDVDADALLIKEGKRMAHELMAKQHQLELLRLETQIQQLKSGLVVNGALTGENFEDKVRRLPTIREKMFALASEEKAELQAVLDAGYDKEGREWKQVINKFESLKERVIGGEL